MSALPAVAGYDPFPEPLSIAEIRAGHVAHVLPEHADTPALLRLGHGMREGRPYFSTMRVYPDGSVTAGPGLEPVIDGDLILGFRPVAA